MLTPTDRRKISIITKYIIENFSASDWLLLGQLTGKTNLITGHPRLLRAMSFGDDDYEFCASQILDQIFTTTKDEHFIEETIDHFDIDLWYQQKHPERYHRIFSKKQIKTADFWTPGYIKMFISHLTSNKDRISSLKLNLADWGISAFVAHEDIQASREWRDEVEAGLETMEILVAIVEPGFKESDWCAQEIGYALGRKIDIIPLKAGLDPFGFFGKYQGIPIKGKTPDIVANDIAQLLFKKQHYRERMLLCAAQAFSSLKSDKKIKLINKLNDWSIIEDDQMRQIIEQSSLSLPDRQSLKPLIDKVSAFQSTLNTPTVKDDDIPF